MLLCHIWFLTYLNSLILYSDFTFVFSGKEWHLTFTTHIFQFPQSINQQVLSMSVVHCNNALCFINDQKDHTILSTIGQQGGSDSPILQGNWHRKIRLLKAQESRLELWDLPPFCLVNKTTHFHIYRGKVYDLGSFKFPLRFSTLPCILA
jgi:hypothetical protein